ncbi:hypothetical protein AMS68_001533 [Peltaster fructicola]|uniref:GP-PDE domain-containing protein n=1 Tax=Peltaster fructicola TaxID=286661 RepID=A0A6H0XMT6_9PEZI|nr:hypothetical protein AMS68_001533 [Peltaster fructicola]
MATTPKFTFPDFTQAKYDSSKRKLPQCIAHRGYRAAYPENTILAFQAAIDNGAQAIETDIHITKDETVVLSHDPTMKRCFGRPEKIVDCTWEELRDVKTIRKPHVPMPRLLDLLDLLSEPGHEEVWCLLDIKMDNNPDDVMRLIALTIAAHSSSKQTWNTRIVLGIWAAKYLPLCLKYLPGFPVMHIGFSTIYARHFFEIDNVGFNMLFQMLVAPGGVKFIREAKQKYHRQVVAWTVNTEDSMRWCVRHGLDGVITDDPKLFNQVTTLTPDGTTSGLLPISLRTVFDVVRIYIMVFVLSIFWRKRFLPVASQDLVKAEAIK